MKAKDILALREQREMTDMQQRMLASSWSAFSNSVAGADFLVKLDDMEGSALRAIQDCTDYREATELVIRYQQRRGVCAAMRTYLVNQIESLGGDENEHDADAGTDNSNYA